MKLATIFAKAEGNVFTDLWSNKLIKRAPCNAKVPVQVENYKVNGNSNTHIRVSILKRKLRDWRYPNDTEKKVSLMTQPVSNYAGNTIQTLIDTP